MLVERFLITIAYNRASDWRRACIVISESLY